MGVIVPYKTASLTSLRFFVAHAQKRHPSESVCGDALTMLQTSSRVLVCVIDGAGHGEHARHAADRLVSCVHDHPDAALDELLYRGNAELAGTRGAAASLLAFTDTEVQFAGAGNVEMRAWCRSEFFAVPAPGTLGHSSPQIHIGRAALSAGDIFVLHTDGAPSPLRTPPHIWGYQAQELSREILYRNAKGPDDATVAVVRVEAA